VHFHEVDAGLEDDKSGVGGAPAVGKYDDGGIDEESCLGEVLDDES
jgi:hypothetical protein